MPCASLPRCTPVFRRSPSTSLQRSSTWCARRASSTEGWFESLDPVQLSIRLLVPPGSLLLADPEFATSRFDETALTWRWRHPDPRMDRLQEKVARAVEDAAVLHDPVA